MAVDILFIAGAFNNRVYGLHFTSDFISLKGSEREEVRCFLNIRLSYPQHHLTSDDITLRSSRTDVC